MAAVHFTIDLRDQSSDGSGPYYAKLRRGATEPSDGTLMLTQNDGTKNPPELVDTAQGYISDYIVSVLQTDLLN